MQFAYISWSWKDSAFKLNQNNIIFPQGMIHHNHLHVLSNLLKEKDYTTKIRCRETCQTQQ